MNATVKRKFNALLQGIGNRPPTAGSTTSDQNRHDDTSSLPPRDATESRTGLLAPASSPPSVSPSPSSSSLRMGADLEFLAKKRRVGGGPGLTPTKDTGSPLRLVGASISNITLRKLASDGSPAPERRKSDAGPPKYCPGDREQLLRRLATFQELTDWTPKPDRVNEIEWAKRGWVCQGKERVRCTLCSRELVVKLNRKEVDGKEIPVLIASEIAESVVAKYTELSVASHAEDCLWRKKGCDGEFEAVPCPIYLLGMKAVTGWMLT